MRCLTLNELPPPPRGKTGWPWTEESPQLPDTMPDGSPWPRVSIVTPSYNAADFIEEALRSALLQGYPDIELIVIDGGSTDGTVEILRKYDPWITYWVSEPDRGQSHALNKGFARATGEWLGWLNADDTYVRGALARVAPYLASDDVDLVYGDVLYTDERGEFHDIFRSREFSLAAMAEGGVIHTPSVFWKRRLNAMAGPVSEAYHFTMDNEFWLRVVPHARCRYASMALSTFRRHAGSKTVLDELSLVQESYHILAQYLLKEPYKSAVTEKDMRRILGETLWLEGVLLLRSGQFHEARQRFEVAIERFRLLEEAPDSAALRTVRQLLEDYTYDKDQIQEILDALPLSDEQRRQFDPVVWDMYYQVHFYGGFKRGESLPVLRSALPLVRNKPRRLTQRGYLSITLRSTLALLKQGIHAA